MKKIRVCTTCGSADVLIDAFVHANNPNDVRTFDDTYCQSCDGPCQVQTVEVPDDFDIESDFWKEGAHVTEQTVGGPRVCGSDDDVEAGDKIMVNGVVLLVQGKAGDCEGCVGVQGEWQTSCEKLPACRSDLIFVKG